MKTTEIPSWKSKGILEAMKHLTFDSFTLFPSNRRAGIYMSALLRSGLVTVTGCDVWGNNRYELTREGIAFAKAVKPAPVEASPAPEKKPLEGDTPRDKVRSACEEAGFVVRFADGPPDLFIRPHGSYGRRGLSITSQTRKDLSSRRISVIVPAGAEDEVIRGKVQQFKAKHSQLLKDLQDDLARRQEAAAKRGVEGPLDRLRSSLKSAWRQAHDANAPSETLSAIEAAIETLG